MSPLAGLLYGGAKAAVKMAPYVAGSEAIGYARRNLPGGKYIPSYAELLPWFMGGGKGEAAAGAEAEAVPKDAGDSFRNVPDPEADVFRQPAPKPTPTPTPAAAAAEGVSARSGAGVQNAPYTYSGESALRQVLTGLGNQDLLKVAKSRGIDIAREAQLKPGVADSRIVEKVINDFSPEELDDFRDTYLEATRQGRPFGVGPEAYTTRALQQFFPDLKLPQARLARTQKAFANRPPANNLYELLNQSQ
jgi:hypothetical protein